MSKARIEVLNRLIDKAFAHHDEDEIVRLDRELRRLEDAAAVESEIANCADCGEPSETKWKDGTPLCYGCAYGRAGWE